MALTVEEQDEYGVDARGIVSRPSPFIDPELGAMYAIVAALDPLDDAARGRVLGWAVERFGGEGE